MRLTLFNGSPRAVRSNTRILLDWFLEGYHHHAGHQSEVLHVNRRREREQQVRRLAAAERVIIAFPLYHDSMPSILKELIEALAPLCSRPENPPLGFIVQSGLPEAHHSRFVERYLEKLAHRLHSRYLGTVVKGGVEGIQVKPSWMTRGTRRGFIGLGRRFGESGAFDPRLAADLARPERLSAVTRLMIRALTTVNLTNLYWDQQLRKHGVHHRRFDRPLAD
jgi:NAD(P)H-dependent FMN reductase